MHLCIKILPLILVFTYPVKGRGFFPQNMLIYVALYVGTRTPKIRSLNSVVWTLTTARSSEIFSSSLFFIRRYKAQLI